MSNERRALRLLSALFALGLLAGCSALINPDEGRLGGGEDAGVSLMDSGPGGDDGGPDTDGGDPGEDAGAACPGGCDDGVACTVDRCEDGSCRHAPDDGMCPAEERCNPVLGCVPFRCTRDAECDDGLYCNGAETCDPEAGDGETGCVAGEPVDCDDGAACTADRCDEELDRCVSEPDDAVCDDGVDCTVDRCDPAGEADERGCVIEADDAFCDGFCIMGGVCNPSVGCVGGTERDCREGDPCTADTCNEAAAMCEHELRDEDGDSFGTASAFGSEGLVSCDGTDCDDGDDQQYPGATERCNGEDDDCDMTVDEGCTAGAPDDCGSAQEIVLSDAGAGSVSGSFADVGHDFGTNPLCDPGSNGPDAVYYFDLPSGRWDVTLDTLGSAADTILAVGFECSGSGFLAACNDDYGDPSVTRDSRIWLHNVGQTFGTTRIWVLVDAYSGSASGSYTLNVERRPAAPDRCPGPVGSDAPLDISGGGTVLGVVTGAAGSQRGSCQGDFDVSPEAVLRLRGPGSGNVELDVYSLDFTPDAYLREAPCGSGTELACDVGSSVGGGVSAASVAESVTSGDLHYFFVDNGRGTYAVYYRPF